MYSYTVGGNDTLTGVAGANNTLYGDAETMNDDAIGGGDKLIGGTGAGTPNYLAGDANWMNNAAHGGNDVLTGGADADFNYLWGDAWFMYDDAVGGNDVLTGGADADFNELFGDALYMYGAAVGGNDVLTGVAGMYNTLYGDAYGMPSDAVGGNDVLISGTGTDYMYGDCDVAALGVNVTTGTDLFVFKTGSGDDSIYDFRQSDHDKIDVSGYGFHNIGALGISDNDTHTTIDFGGGNTVTLLGFADSTLLTAADFIFA